MVDLTEAAATDAAVSTGSWRELLGRRYLGTSAVLAGGVALYATNEFLTISLLPSTIRDIGGERYYAWATTLYLVGSVVAAAAANAVLVRIGSRSAYLLGVLSFGAGAAVCAVAPHMEILLIGRTLQGMGGGLLAGLGYALINAVLPSWLWTRASGLVSAMWGVGTLVGPAAGGLFAQFGIWRWAFGLMVVLSGVMCVAVSIVLRASRGGHHGEPMKIPVRSLLLLGGAALVVSTAQLPRNLFGAAGLLVAGAVLLALFLVVDRRSSSAVLPPSAFHPGREKWIYLTLGLLMATTKANLYIPLLGQRLAHLAPIMAGFLGAALSTGWTISEIASASVSKARVIVGLVISGPLVMAAGLAVVAFARMSHYNPTAVGAIWALALLVVGIGVGAGWPHLSAWAMSCVDDPAEGGTAAAAINTVTLIGGAFGAGIAGLVVNTAMSAGEPAARWLFAIFAALAAAGCVVSYRASRGADEPSGATA
ncbi:MFS transporter [Mycolicibacter sp. MYC340]|uniref:MFS transporter n=1 Tax=[Mycobacterium] nativiensis TaxID=2855503 RepID=A0ABU5XYR2_9MYCO|nr:MFS transporter [Mycolicibacter sp. MYC340]MEB3033136.1 MFS transporter [Mycolicibacter sp. MYC340]